MVAINIIANIKSALMRFLYLFSLFLKFSSALSPGYTVDNTDGIYVRNQKRATKMTGGFPMKQKVSSFFKEMTKNRALYLMFLPAAIILILFNYLPMFGQVFSTFFDAECY